jgi:hypothetical protein
MTSHTPVLCANSYQDFLQGEIPIVPIIGAFKPAVKSAQSFDARDLQAIDSQIPHRSLINYCVYSQQAGSAALESCDSKGFTQNERFSRLTQEISPDI